MIDLDSLVPGSSYFRWREFLYAPQWNCFIFPSPEQHGNLIKLVEKLDAVRELFKKPIQVTSGLRVFAYNELIGGAKSSQHCLGRAADIKIFTMSCDEIRMVLEPRLEHMGLRMENKPNSEWVHLDIKNVLPGEARFFIP